MHGHGAGGRHAVRAADAVQGQVVVDVGDCSRPQCLLSHHGESRWARLAGVRQVTYATQDRLEAQQGC